MEILRGGGFPGGGVHFHEEVGDPWLPPFSLTATRKTQTPDGRLVVPASHMVGAPLYRGTQLMATLRLRAHRKGSAWLDPVVASLKAWLPEYPPKSEVLSLQDLIPFPRIRANSSRLLRGQPEEAGQEHGSLQTHSSRVLTA